MTRILALTKYSRAGPSSRVRTYQFLPYFEKAGLDVRVEPLFGDSYVKRLYGEGRRDKAEVARAYVRRLALLANPPPHDVVWVEKEAFPWLPAALESTLSARLEPMVVDYDDAIFHNYDLHRRGLVRAVLSRKIDSVMKRAALVVAGNSYLKARALQAGARRVEVLPSVVDVWQYVARRPLERPVVTVGWIGSPITAPYVALVRDQLVRLQEKHGIRVKLIGSGPVDLSPLKVEVVPWTEAGQPEDLADLDIGIMPLEDDPWERGKCGFKIIQYMAAARPAVASAVGANNDIVEPGVTGFLASTPDDWFEQLERLILDPALRRTMGEAARKAAEARFSTDVVGPRLAELLKEIAVR